MIIEVRVEYHDPLDNYCFEVLEIPIDREKNIEATLRDKVNDWFFRTAETLFQESWGSKINCDEEEFCYESAFETYLNNTEFKSDLD